MTVTPLPHKGNSTKFLVTVNRRGDFIIAFSFTLKTQIWALSSPAEELAVAKEVAEAIVSRHDPSLPFKDTYVFGDHNTEPTWQDTVKHLRRFSA